MVTDPPSLLLKTMIKDFHDTYQSFLESNHLEDCAWNRVLYYAAVELIIVSNPLPNEALQFRLKRHMTLEKVTAIENYQEEIKALLEKTIKNRAAAKRS